MSGRMYEISEEACRCGDKGRSQSLHSTESSDWLAKSK